MRRMNKDELALFEILKNNDRAKKNNYEAIKLFYLSEYNKSFPDLSGLPSIFTIERYIRRLKQLYPKQLTSEEEREIKSNKELEYREYALDDNAPILPKEAIDKWW